MTAEHLRHMQLHTAALYTYDSNGWITGCNQFDGGEVPRFHLARTTSANYCIFRNDLSNHVVGSIQRYAAKEPPLRDPKALPLYNDHYLEILSSQRPVEAIWHGPAYRFTTLERQDVVEDAVGSKDEAIIEINGSNSPLLATYMSDWLPDVPHRKPFLGVVSGTHVVAVCASVRITPGAHEAGVETLPSHRRQGYAAKVVAAWAKAVSQTNAVPLYSTSWDNHASQSVAASLGLELIGTDFHIR